MSDRSRTPTISIRMLWPFARLLGGTEDAVTMLESWNVGLEEFGNPETRISHAVAMKALLTAIERHGDPLIGLRAGQIVDHGDFDVLEYAARAAPSFGEAMRVMSRYLRIMHEGVHISIEVDGHLAIWRTQIASDVPVPPALNDFIIACSLAFSKRNVAVYEDPIEIRMMHARPDYADEVERRFGAKVTYGATHNMIVMRRERLDVPMLRASPEMSKAFEHQARRTLEKLFDKDSLADRVRNEVAAQLRTGQANMGEAARRLAMGVATLRRKLEDDGTTFRDIVDELREELALAHLATRDVSVSEIAFLLGFSNVRAFGRAFRRWTGQSPSEFRAGRRDARAEDSQPVQAVPLPPRAALPELNAGSSR
jgi:AraC-like DNA-binding protein